MRRARQILLLLIILACEEIDGPAVESHAGFYHVVQGQVIANGSVRDSIVSGTLDVKDWSFTARIHYVRRSGSDMRPDSLIVTGSNFTAGAPGCGSEYDPNHIFITPLQGDTIQTQSPAMFARANILWVK